MFQSSVSNQQSDCSKDCKFACCSSCSFCNRAVAKEKRKTLSCQNRNKICEQCFDCKSMSFCPKCHKCTLCCQRSTCGRPSATVLAGLALPGVKSKGSLHPQGRVSTTLQGETTSSKISCNSQWFISSFKKQKAERSLTVSRSKTGYRKSVSSVISGLLQPVVPGSKTQQKMEAHSRPKSTEPVPCSDNVQDGNSGDHQTLPATGGVGHFAGFQRRLFSHSHKPQVAKISQVPLKRSNLSVHSTSLWPVDGSVGVHKGGQRGKTHGSIEGYSDPPIPRRLVTESPMPGNLPTSYADPFGPLPLSRLGSQHGQVRAGSPTNLRLRRLSFRPISGVSQTNSGQVEESISKAQPSPGTGMLLSQAVHVFDRPSDSNRKTSSIGEAAYETHSMAPKKALACPGISGEGHSNSFISPCTSQVVVGPGQGALRSALTPSSTRPSTVYRRLKRRLERSLRRLHGKRSLVRVRRRLAHKFVGAQGSPAGLKTVRAVMLQPDSSCLYRQHHCGLLHQQGRGYEIRLTLCPPLETDALVQSKADCPEGQAYSGSPERHCRQTVPTQSGDPNGMVSPPGGVCSNMPALAPPVCGPVCHPVQSQTSPVCIPGSRPISVGSGCLKSPLGGLGRLCVSTDGPSSSGGNETLGPRIPSSHSDSTRLAQHALVLGPGQHVSSNSPPAPSGVEFDNSTVQSVSSPGPSQSEPSCLAPRASAIQQAGFSAEVATRIEAPQRRSTRAIYESKWSVFVRWCEKNKVDFRTPSIEQIADFLLSLFQEKHLQPSTIEGYRTAIADKVGNSRFNISKDENLSRLLDSFHRDKPKGRRGVPTWNLSLVLHQLTQPPFEPLRKASLKYLTFKTVFLLALGSGKRRSEIHAWVHRNIRHQEDWSNVSLSPSPSFISKNHLAKEGPACVAPVIIPALAPSLDKSLKEDRSLCPVRALRYYLDKTKDLRSGKELVFVSFRKSFQKDIVPATVSSWIKQTIVLCYQMSGQQAQQLHQVRAHDVRAFAASKAFQGGVPLDQILAACHWKSHNTFTQFYLKDLAWADSDVYHLGPVVAAQQIRD